MAKFQNNKKKDWFSNKTELAFIPGEVFKDGSRNSPAFEIEIFATICNVGKLKKASPGYDEQANL